MKGRPTTSMKKGWFYRISYDKKNQEIAPFWDSTWWWSRLDDDPDQVMIQIWWWCSDDDPIVVMIQIQWWRILEEEDDLEEYLKMKVTWRWRRLEDDEDEEDEEDKEDEDNLKMKMKMNMKMKMIQSIQRRRPVLKIVSKEYLPS